MHFHSARISCWQDGCKGRTTPSAPTVKTNECAPALHDPAGSRTTDSRHQSRGIDVRTPDPSHPRGGRAGRATGSERVTNPVGARTYTGHRPRGAQLACASVMVARFRELAGVPAGLTSAVTHPPSYRVELWTLPGPRLLTSRRFPQQGPEVAVSRSMDIKQRPATRSPAHWGRATRRRHHGRPCRSG